MERDAQCPLRQAPLNMLFVPRVPVVPFAREAPRERTFATPTAPYLHLLHGAPPPAPLSVKRRPTREEMRAHWRPWDCPAATPAPERTAFVARLAPAVTPDALRAALAPHGALEAVCLVRSRRAPQRHRGYAFVLFADARSVRVAERDADGMRVAGRRVIVDHERGRLQASFLPNRLLPPRRR